MSNDYSRALLLASTATCVDGDLQTHLENQSVVVSCDPEPGAVRATRVLLTLLRRLPLMLVLDRRGVTDEEEHAIHTAVAAVDPRRPLRFDRSGLRVHIGQDAAEGTLRVIPSRHGAHVVRDGRRVMAEPPSPLGSCVAAAMAAAAIFKQVVEVRPERRFDPAHAAFCPVTLGDRPENAAPLTLPFAYSGAIVGLGAIGSATAMILGELETAGDIDLVDRQRYARENVATYSLGGDADATAAVWKTELAERALPHARCRRFDCDIEGYLKGVQRGDIAAPAVVLAGLDSVEARHEAQYLWPDLLIDGATGDTMLGLHVVEGAGQPCMQCFLQPRVAVSSYDRLSEVTGLSVAMLRDGDAVFTEADLASATPEQRDWLAPHIGKKVCGLAQAVGLTEIASDGFQPSVAFVALGAACLVVGRLVAETFGIAPNANFVQYDALIGASRATVDLRRAMPTCYCVARAANIARVREQRFGARAAVLQTGKTSTE